MFNTILERQMNPAHLKLIIFSEALAKGGIGEYTDALTRWRQLRRTIYIAVSRGEAKRVIEAVVTPNEDNPAKFLEMMSLTQDYVGYTPRSQFLKFYNALETKGEEAVAMLVALWLWNCVDAQIFRKEKQLGYHTNHR